MPRDFAHKGNGGRQTAPRRALPGWLWLLVGVALGFAGAVAYYISRPTQVEQVVAKITDKKDETHKKITIPPKQPGRFAFYDLLPTLCDSAGAPTAPPLEGRHPEPELPASGYALGPKHRRAAGAIRVEREHHLLRVAGEQRQLVRRDRRSHHRDRLRDPRLVCGQNVRIALDHDRPA